MSEQEESFTNDIAIIGFSGRFPGADTVAAFWENLCKGVEAIHFFEEQELLAAGVDPILLRHPDYVRAAPLLGDIEYFDAAFFAIPPREATLMDPQQRLFLECAWEAMEVGGYDPDRAYERVGVFAGAGTNNYLLRNLMSNKALIEQEGFFKIALLNEKDHLAMRTSYKLKLNGPSISINTACSTSLVTIHLAVQSLLNGECDMALAGGVAINIPQREGYLYQEGGVVSPDGHCRAFDQQAAGSIRGSGAGVVLLKRMSDAMRDQDSIYAMIKGSAVNNDGAAKIGYTAPSIEGQSNVIVEAQGIAGISAEMVTYIETHGTGTVLGDPIEIEALTRAFRLGTEKTGFCAIGSLKTNIGHLDAAAGVASVIKTTLALHHKQLPPSLHYTQPNVQIDFAHSPFYVNTQFVPWKEATYPRTAGVSSFGIGGTNAHLVVQEAPPRTSPLSTKPWHLLTLSARTPRALEAATAQLMEHLRKTPDLLLDDVAYTLQVGRKQWMQRRAVVCQDIKGAIDALTIPDTGSITTTSTPATPGEVVFLFPGQGAQYPQMASELYQHESVFRRIVDECAERFQPYLQFDLRECIYPAVSDTSKAEYLLQQTAITQPALFTIEYALAQLWIHWGVLPTALIGHSIGEYVAACVAGIFSLEDAIRLVAIRGKLIQSLPAGGMLAISLSAAQVAPLLNDQLALAASNTPSRCVVSGPLEQVQKLEEQLSAQSIACRRLHTSHAFHSPMMSPIQAVFTEEVKKVQRNPPVIPCISNVTGQWISDTEVRDPNYWAQHLRQVVRFAEGVQTLCAQPQRIFLEVGPGNGLSVLVKQHPACTSTHQVVSSLPHPQGRETDLAHILHALGQLWVNGVSIDWAGCDYYGQHRIALPTYPFERQRYWISEVQTLSPQEMPVRQEAEETFSAMPIMNGQQGVDILTSSIHKVMSDGHSMRYETIAKALKTIFGRLLGIDLATTDGNSSFLEVGADSLLLLQVSKIIQDEFDQKIPFRLLLETYTTFNELAGYLDRVLPPEPDAVPPLVHAPAPAQSRNEPVPVPIHSTRLVHYQQPNQPSTAERSGLEQVVGQQLQLMAQQLELLQASYGLSSVKDQNEVATLATAPIPKNTLLEYERKEMREEPAALPPIQSSTIDQGVRSLQLDPEVFIPYKPRKVESIKGLSDRQWQHITGLIQRIEQRTRRSKELAQQYRPFLADNRGTAGFNFTFKEIVYPLAIEHAKETRVWDVDGNSYIDITMGFGALLFGHTPDFILQSLTSQLQKGIRLGWQSNMVGETARLLCELTGVERVSFCNSGTEAVMTALRLARAVTGKAKIAVFAGAFHGTFDGVLVRGEESVEGGLRTIPLAPGIPEHMIKDVIMLHFGRTESLEILKTHAHDLAAVLVELPQSRRPDLVPNQFLFDLRQMTEALDVALIFDEVVAGFRMHPGGAQALVGVQADIVTYGKALGGGFPVAAIGGKAKYLDAIDGGMWSYGDASYPAALQTFYAGTHFRHPSLIPMVHAILTHLKESGPQLQEQLNLRTAQLVQALDHFFEQAHIPIRMSSFGSLFRFVFPTAYKTVTANVFYYHLLEKGIYISETRNCFLSTVHTDEDVNAIIKAVHETIGELIVGGFFEPLPPDLPADSKTDQGSSSISPIELDTAPDNVTLGDNQVQKQEPASLILPLTEQQKELWIVSQLAPEASRVYNELLQLNFQGTFHLNAMQQALQKLVMRHEALRTTFSPEGDMQRIHPHMKIEVGLKDISNLDRDHRAEQLVMISTQEARTAFDFETGPLIRALLVKEADQEHRLFFTVHHLVADGWSVSTLLHELQLLYGAQSSGQEAQLPVPMRYSDYMQWQKQQEDIQVEAEAYWLQLYADGIPTPQLPTDYSRPALKTFHGGEQVMRIEGELYQRLKQLGQEQQCTLFVVLLTAYSLLLARLTAQTEVVVLVPTAGQLQVDTTSLVGHCVNLLPLRLQINSTSCVSELLRHVKQALLDAFPHQLPSLSRIIEQLSPRRATREVPFGGFLFNLDQLESLSFADLKTTICKNTTDAANFDLSLHAVQTKTDISLECGYNSDLFAPQTIQRWLHHLMVVLSEYVERPEQPLMQVSLLTAEERQRLLMSWNDTEQNYPAITFAHTLFEKQVAEHPDRIAIVTEDHTLTYGMLNAQANQLAHYLHKLGAGPEVCVGLCMERTLYLVIGMLGVLKAGAAHLSLDPSYPQVRLEFVISDAQISIVLTQQYLEACFLGCTTRQIYLDTCWQDIAGESTENCSCEVSAENAAYVLYTSGSTGQPKGVVLPHKSLTNLLYWKQAAYELGCEDRMLMDSPISFDTFTYQVYLPLFCGAQFYLVPQEKEQDPVYMSELIKRQGVTYASMVPAILNLFIEEHVLEDCKSLRIVGCGGDAITEQICNYFIEHPQQTLWNMYGPTETTIHATSWQCNAAEMRRNPPIGRPIANYQVYILDHWLQPVPVGVPGELHIGGVGLARGYLHLPALTAEKFIPDPFLTSYPGARIYKTGDLACYLPDGSIQFLGRIDHQVKVRGVRIELGEIEAVLRQHPALQDALVMLRKDLPSDNSLVAYVVQRPTEEITSISLRTWLSERLPTTMLPAGYVVLNQWPLLPSGKIDQQALLTMVYEQADPSAAWVAPRSPMEEIISDIWCEVLAKNRVGVFDNFFELGGHSLLAMQVLARIHREIAVDLPFRTLFELPTIARLAERLEHTHHAPVLPPLVAQGRVPTEQIVLSYAQKRLWVLYQMEPESPFYNVPLVLQLHGFLNLKVLEQALAEIVQRHEILRTSFVVEGGEPLQRILDTQALSITSADLRSIEPLKRDKQIRQQIQGEVLRPFQLEQGPLLRSHIVQVSEMEHTLIFTFHHSIFDGWSSDLFLRELSTLYTAFSQQQPSPLPALPVQYRDYALWQQQWLQGETRDELLAFWHKQLAEAPRILHLPTDYPRPAMQTFHGDVLAFQLSPALSQHIRDISHREGVTVFMTLLTAFGILLARHSQQQDILIGSPIARRPLLELENLIGVFMNTLTLRIDLKDNPTVRTMLKRVRAMVLDAYTYQDLPFEMLVDTLHIKRDMSYSPLFQVMFTLENSSRTVYKLADIPVQLRDVEGAIAKFDLTLSMTDTGRELTGNWEYNTDLFMPETIQRWNEHFQVLLSALVSDTEQVLERLPLLTAQERVLLIEQWNTTESIGEVELCVHTLFEEQVTRTPHTLAVVSANRRLSYQQLNRQANVLARRLSKSGVGPEQRVAIYMERSLELLVAIIGTLKSGGAYVPLDPSYPQERLQYLLTDAQPQVILMQKGKTNHLLQSTAQVIEVELQECNAADDYNTCSDVQSDNLAYIIYTSGSTGRPKGVMIPHRGVVNYLNWCRKHYLVAPERQVPVHSSISFDLTITSIFAPLQSGQCLHLLDEAERGEALGNAIRQGASYDFVKLTPAHLDLLAQHLGAEMPEVAQTLIVGGEVLNEAQLRPWLRNTSHIHIVNEYGPTETVVGCCTYTISAEDASQESSGNVPIGKPIENMRLYVLDRLLEPVPIGVQGEIYIAGPGVGRGYRNQPEQTATAFIPNPFTSQPGERLYKTGDRAYWRADGNLVYLGRQDQQVKIHGFRIEMGEIEAVLRQHPQVQECIVDVRTNELYGKHLVAYIVRESSSDLTVQEVRSTLKDSLPAYMLPVVYLFVDTLPLTPNGKVNRKALPDSEAFSTIDRSTHISPVTPIEKALVEIWSQVLGLSSIGIHDNFFELGGDSIVGMLMALKARDSGLELSSKQLFQYQTIAELATHTSMADKVSQEETLVHESVPLTPIQHWFFTLNLPTRHHWNQSVLLDIQEQVPFALLQKCLQTVFIAHDALHLRFLLQNGKWQQTHADDRSVPVQRHDLQHLSLQEQDVAISQLINEAQASLDLSNGPLFRCIFFDLSAERPAKLLLIIHHLAIDIVSWQILLTELSDLCQKGLHNGNVYLPRGTTSYRSWATQLVAYAQTAQLHQEADYWLSLDWKAVKPLPTDYPGGFNKEDFVRTLEASLSVQESHTLLHDVFKVQRMQVHELLIAALTLTLVQATENPVQLIDIERHGREDVLPGIDLSSTVGWFTALAPLCVKLNKSARQEDKLKTIKEQIRTQPHGGIGYALLRYLTQDTQLNQRFSSLPRADIVFNYEGHSAQVLATDTLFTPAAHVDSIERATNGSRTHLLALNASIRHNCLQIELTYSENLYTHKTVMNMLNTYMATLRSFLVVGQETDGRSYIPSDFPAAHLEQEQLTKLLTTLQQQEEQYDNEDE